MNHYELLLTHIGTVLQLQYLGPLLVGTIAGVTLVDGGDEIVIANGDRSVGGLMSFRRSYSSYNYSNDYYYSPKDNCRRKAGRRRATAGRGAVVEEFLGV